MTSTSPISLSSRGEWSLRTPESSLSSLSDHEDDDVIEEIFTPLARGAPLFATTNAETAAVQNGQTTIVE